jgi:hypothetical protein
MKIAPIVRAMASGASRSHDADAGGIGVRSGRTPIVLAIAERNRTY